MSAWCLITDIDGTVIGDRQSTLALREAVLQERAALAARGERLYWVIATGRRLRSTREVLLDEGFQLSDFDALVTSVGAELYHRGALEPCIAYRTHLGASGFDRKAVLAALGKLEFLELQIDSEQFSHKVSYVLTDTATRRERTRAALAALPFATETVFSHDSYLDVTPACGAKGGAVAHLLRVWDVDETRAVAAGDSGNDSSMLERAWRGIVVGNGHRALAHLRPRESVYFARGHFAAGVLEGLVAHGFLP
jgi:sucrose-phosphate synthase